MKSKILIMAPTPPPIMGPSIATTILLNSSLTEDFDIKFIDTADRRELKFALAKIDFENIFLAILHTLKLIWQNLFFRPKVVYFLVNQTTIGYLRDSVFIIVNSLFGRKQIVHLRGGYFPRYYHECGSLMKWYIRLTLTRVDRFIVLCQRTKKEMAGIIPDHKIVVIPNGRDLPQSHQIKLQNNPTVVLYLGNLIKTKGFFDLLHAVPMVLKNNNSVIFKFAGEWRSDDDRLQAEAFILKHGLSEIVCFLGSVAGETKDKLLSDAGIFVFPTYYKYEGHPWVIVEALAASLPIITTNHACISESIEDGVSGFLVPKNDPKSIAVRLTELLDNDELRMKMSASSLEYYQQHFTEKKFIDSMKACFRSVIE